MKKFYLFAATAAAMLASFQQAYAKPGWPAQYEGVMLQGFYWDSYGDTKWTNLESQADELSRYFKLIWVPNSGRCGDGNNMGYMPQYWFTNHNSSFGTEAELRSMIKTFKDKGTGIIADVVVNHRNGVTNWYDFPVETWRGKTYQIGLDGICRNDEMAANAGQPKPTGNYDTGDNFDGCRDLDHTNQNVQDNIKDYCKFLLEDLGYTGFRYDMVKGYSGQYNKIYNDYSQPEYSVGEYWDSSYDAVAGWIEATGKTSTAFDFPLKSCINEAFHSGDLSKLVWKANGDNPQPAGLIHYGYPQYSVTFVDNHDTYRDGSKFNGNVLAANAFILCSPGTPCVFLPHYQQNKAAIQALIDARNLAGVSNTSTVKVLKSDNDCYMAEVQGSKGKLAVKIGSEWITPDGYNNNEIKASGNDYCVWVKPKTEDDYKEFTIYFDNFKTEWETPHVHYWGGDTQSEYPGVAMTYTGNHIWSYTVPAGTTNCLFNAGDGDATKTGDFVATKNHLYYKPGENESGELGEFDPDNIFPEEMYLIGNLEIGSWNTTNAIPAHEIANGVYRWKNVTITTPPADGAPSMRADEAGLFNFISKTGKDWDEVNNFHRFGAAEEGTPFSKESEVKVTKYVPNVNASATKSWKTQPGKYNLELNLNTMTLRHNLETGVNDIDAGTSDAKPIYFDLMGRTVTNPQQGIYIVKRGAKTSKVVIR